MEKFKGLIDVANKIADELINNLKKSIGSDNYKLWQVHEDILRGQWTKIIIKNFSDREKTDKKR